MILAGTGHRPPKLGLSYSESDGRRLAGFVRAELAKITGITRVISGMATGFDQALAEAAIALSLPLTAAVPFEGMDAKWPAAGRERYRDILAKADDVRVICDGGYAARKFIVRDRWMVENCDTLLALYDTGERASGTGATVAWAEGRGVPVIHIWEAWLIRVG